MKKEFLFIMILLLILVSSIFIKMFFISDAQKEMLEETKKYTEVRSIYIKDSLTQKSINLAEVLFNNNKDEDKAYGVKVGLILGTLESILKECKIKYDQNELKPRDEVLSNNGYNCYLIDLNFNTDFDKYMDFISLLEKNKEIIDIISMDIYRCGVEKHEKEKKIKKDLKVSLVIQFLKFA